MRTPEEILEYEKARDAFTEICQKQERLICIVEECGHGKVTTHCNVQEGAFAFLNGALRSMFDSLQKRLELKAAEADRLWHQANPDRMGN